MPKFKDKALILGGTMGRKKLVWYPGALYHITTRGNHRNDIFKDGEDYLVYLTQLKEVFERHCVAGLLKNRGALIKERPFRAPHHNASMNSLIGGGNYAKPGEISLLYKGV
jgi:magnesium chelatase family protein